MSNKRSIIKPKGGRLTHTGKFRLPDGTVKVVPELGIENITPPSKSMKSRQVKKFAGGGCVMSGRGGSFKGTM